MVTVLDCMVYIVTELVDFNDLRKKHNACGKNEKRKNGRVFPRFVVILWPEMSIAGGISIFFHENRKR